MVSLGAHCAPHLACSGRYQGNRHARRRQGIWQRYQLATAHPTAAWTIASRAARGIFHRTRRPILIHDRDHAFERAETTAKAIASRAAHGAAFTLAQGLRRGPTRSRVREPARARVPSAGNHVRSKTRWRKGAVSGSLPTGAVWVPSAAARCHVLQTQSAEWLNSSVFLRGRMGLLICGLWVRFPPGSPLRSNHLAQFGSRTRRRPANVWRI